MNKILINKIKTKIEQIKMKRQAHYFSFSASVTSFVGQEVTAEWSNGTG